MFRLRVLGVLFVTCLACACGGSTEEEEAWEGAVVVEPGKADNFFSLSAQEYFVTGEYYVDLEAEYETATEEERLKRVQEMTYYKQVAINWFLLQHLMGPEDDHDNKFQSLTKNGSYEDLEIRVDETNPLRYWFKLRQEVAGQLDLVEELAPTPASDGSYGFSLSLGKVSNSKLMELDINDEWYRESPWKGFNPATVDPTLVEQIELTIMEQPGSADAWPDYKQMFEDGEVTIGLHFGWDYHKEYHLVHSKDTYNWLVNSMDFDSPAGSYEEYSRTSGPLSRTIDANGKEVLVKIWLFWGKAGTDTDPDTDAGGKQLEKDMRTSFKNREVIMFSGHSGPFYGFALANWKKTDEGDLDDSEIPDLDLPNDTYQVVLAEGCDTYAMGEAFWKNPAKGDEKNLDIITTTNFSNASTAGVVKNFIQAMVKTDSAGNHEPWKYSDLLRKLDGNSSWFHSMYGVHGVDDNPRLHPYAEEANFCGECAKNEDCGGIGNLCVKISSDDRVCTAECVSSDACPGGYECMKIAENSWITKKQCVPKGLTCAETLPKTDDTLIMINEILADPAPGSEGDANGSGERDATDDEFVEMVSRSADPIDLAGWALADGNGIRAVFPYGATLQPGRALLVFGGGSPDTCTNFENENGTVTFFAKGLGLNNDGDWVRLLRPDGTVEDEVHFGNEASQDRSLVREVEGDPDAAFILHPGSTPFSPGTKADGSLF